MLLSLKDYLTDDTENKIVLIKIISDRRQNQHPLRRRRAQCVMKG